MVQPRHSTQIIRCFAGSSCFASFLFYCSVFPQTHPNVTTLATGDRLCFSHTQRLQTLYKIYKELYKATFTRKSSITFLNLLGNIQASRYVKLKRFCKYQVSTEAWKVSSFPNLLWQVCHSFHVRFSCCWVLLPFKITSLLFSQPISRWAN